MKKVFTLMAVAALMAACFGNANKPAEVVEEDVIVVEECACAEGGECTCAEGECTCADKDAAAATEAPATEEAPAE